MGGTTLEHQKIVSLYILFVLSGACGLWKHLELGSGVVIYEQLVIATLFPKLLYEHIA